MTSLASGLFKSLPKPKYTGEEEDLPPHAQPSGPRVVGADQLDETQVVLRVSCLISNLRGRLAANRMFRWLREPALHPTEIVQAGDRELPKISAMAARFPRF